MFSTLCCEKMIMTHSLFIYDLFWLSEWSLEKKRWGVRCGWELCKKLVIRPRVKIIYNATYMVNTANLHVKVCQSWTGQSKFFSFLQANLALISKFPVPWPKTTKPIYISQYFRTSPSCLWHSISPNPIGSFWRHKSLEMAHDYLVSNFKNWNICACVCSF